MQKPRRKIETNFFIFIQFIHTFSKFRILLRASSVDIYFCPIALPPNFSFFPAPEIHYCYKQTNTHAHTYYIYVYINTTLLLHHLLPLLLLSIPPETRT